MSVLSENSIIGKYKIQNAIKTNEYTETYRVIDEDENVYFLKLYILKKTPERLVNTETGEIFEIERCKNLVNPNIVSFIDNGTISLDCGECHYFITNYFTGDVLFDKIQRESFLSPDQALSIFRGILNGLKYLHENQLCHNDITPRNIMLSNVASGIPEIIDMGHTAPRCNNKIPFETSDLEILYCANETSIGIYDEQSDIFSATAVFYTMLTGKAPWEMEFNNSWSRARKFNALKQMRNQPLDLDSVAVEDRLKAVICKGLAIKYNDRFKSVDELLSAIDGNTEIEMPKEPKGTSTTSQPRNTPQNNDSNENQNPNSTDFQIEKAKGNGFADIAGMQALKDMLNMTVIFVLKNKEIRERYKLTPPNGMLLYGPPGCGKTFFAEKFAEETGFNFMMVKSSDLASVFIHGSQEKIGQLFKQAQQKAPAVICFDEFDALVPARGAFGAEHQAGEVNEFLSQMNNCSEKGIFVIATSNRPDKIDPAILRTGRIDKQVYVPMPDEEARQEMFNIHLKGRPYNADLIDANKLSKMTDGYIASDIAYIVNDAAMTAAFTNQEITQELLERSIKNTRPSIRPEMLKMYSSIEEQMQNIERRNFDRPSIGFTAAQYK